MARPALLPVRPDRRSAGLQRQLCRTKPGRKEEEYVYANRTDEHQQVRPSHVKPPPRLLTRATPPPVAPRLLRSLYGKRLTLSRPCRGLPRRVKSTVPVTARDPLERRRAARACVVGPPGIHPAGSWVMGHAEHG